MYLRTALFALLALLCAFAHARPADSGGDFVVKEHLYNLDPACQLFAPSNKTQNARLHIALSWRNQDLLEQHLAEIADPLHPQYGQHLSAKEVSDLVRPASEDVALVRSWLEEYDVPADSIVLNPRSDWLSTVTTVGQLERLLNTTFNDYYCEKKAEWDRSIITEYSIPRYVDGRIDLVGVKTVEQAAAPPDSPRGRKRAIEKRSREAGGAPGRAQRTKALSQGLAAMRRDQNQTNQISERKLVANDCSDGNGTTACLRALYGTSDYTPQALSTNRIGVFSMMDDSPNYADLAIFMRSSRPDIAEMSVDIIDISNATNDQNGHREDMVGLEAAIDAQMILGIAAPTKLTSYLVGAESNNYIDVLSMDEYQRKELTSNFDDGFLNWIDYLLNQERVPPVISHSYGGGENSGGEQYDRRFCAGILQLAVRGVSMIFASGDNGVGTEKDCHSLADPTKRAFSPNMPGTCPWVTVVGATGGFNTQVAPTWYASSGGFSNDFATPDWQAADVETYIESLNGLHDGLYNKQGRGYPDVAAQGELNDIIMDGQHFEGAGTSAAAPIFAAIIALVNDALLADGKPPLGFLNPWLYTTARNAFTDVTVGSSFGCGTDGFPARKGWDPVTGLGSPNFKLLLEAAFEPYKQRSNLTAG